VVSSDVTLSAADEWAAIVATALLGTDRRQPHAPEPGWDRWAMSPDPAVALLDRAGAVVVARRAGFTPAAVPDVAVPLPAPDSRPPCSAACAARLERLLSGEHEMLLAEWLDLLEQAGVQLPWGLLPALLLRGRRRPDLDAVVRRLAGDRARWLAELLPELGVKPVATEAATSGSSATTAPTLVRAAPLPRPSAAMAAMVQHIYDGRATWATAPQWRAVVAALPPAELAEFLVRVDELRDHLASVRTRAELTALARFRLDMLHEFGHAAGAGAVVSSPTTVPPLTGDPT
jgi:hypothetical protein